MRYLLTSALFVCALTTMSQSLTTQDSTTLENLKKQILEVQTEMDVIELNLGQTRKRFTRGIIVATIGYTVTITGGLMLGRKNDDLGKALLITGGTVGAAGTFMLIDSFRFMGSPRNRSR